jgi:hypothetical protein
MNKFRVNKPLSDFNNEQNIKMQNFVDGADEHKIEGKNLNPKAKPNKSFTVPLNEYELSLLQQLSQNLDRSQRYTSRMLLVKALENELNIKHN